MDSLASPVGYAGTSGAVIREEEIDSYQLVTRTCPFMSMGRSQSRRVGRSAPSSLHCAGQAEWEGLSEREEAAGFVVRL